MESQASGRDLQGIRITPVNGLVFANHMCKHGGHIKADFPQHVACPLPNYAMDGCDWTEWGPPR